MANNPYVNKVVFGSATLVDLTGTTATADKILSGYGAFGADGAWMDGTATASSGSGVVWQDSQGYVHLSDEGDIPLQTKTVAPSETAQTITPDNGYYALDKVNVGAISSSYVGSSITRRDDDDMTASADTDYYVVNAPSGYYPSSAEYYIPIKTSADLSASGATVSVPSGYYASNASKSVASGTEGTPTATKGAVSNHSISVTPSVTNTGGYISGSTKTGTAVSVSASELVSGTLTISSSGTKDVTNYASVSVPSGTEGTPTATKGTVSSNSISVTPSVTNSTGYITGGTKTGTAVTVSASELVSGTKSISANGTGIDVANYASVDVTVPTGSATLITKSITANGTYNASSDGADGYSQVTVNVSGGGGSTNIVSGDFTAGTAGTVQTINIPYTGTGYIVSLMISVDGGLRGEYFYNVEHRYACGMFCGSKYYVTQAPNYTANNANYNGLTVLGTIKGTSGTAYSNVGSGSSGSAVIYATADPSASSITSIVRITSKNVIKVFISESSSGYGFLSGAKYNYVVVYSE